MHVAGHACSTCKIITHFVILSRLRGKQNLGLFLELHRLGPMHAGLEIHPLEPVSLFP